MAHHDPRREIGAARSRRAAGALRFLLPLAAVGLAAALADSISRALLFFAALAVFVAPGLPLARVFFAPGERGLAACAIGYLSSSLLASLLYRAGLFSEMTVAGASLLLAAGLFAFLRSRAAAEASPPERPALCGILLLVLALLAIPFLRVGERTEQGVAYRAYFSADLMTHLSVTAELQKGDFPPADPFYAGGALGYYWLFFLFPALVGKWTGNQPALLLTYLAGDLLFAGLLFCAARRLTKTAPTAWLAAAAGLAAASYEGAAVLARAILLGQPLSSFREQNVDAFSRWVLELTSVDSLYRSLLYTPQHLFSYSLLLTLMLLLVLPPRPQVRAGAAALAGLVLGGMAGTSIVTAMLAGPWIAWDVVRRGASPRDRLASLVPLALASLACLTWFFHLGFFAEAGGALSLRRPALAELPLIVLLEVGPLFFLALPALADPRSRPLALLAGLSLLAVLGLDVRGAEGVWMAWRAGSVLLVSLALWGALGLPHCGRAARGAILFPALLTTLLDLYNAQDITNRQESAGAFRWTTIVPAADLEALDWIRKRTPLRSRVQLDARAREGGDWALLPALAERRMAYGYPIFLLNPAKYQARARRLHFIFSSDDPEAAHRLAVEAGIDYLFIGPPETRRPENRSRKFWEAPAFFEKAFENAEITIFRVR
jgi:hypothetical protein